MMGGLASNAIFQSTPSVWRETFAAAVCFFYLLHFNPLPPCGGRRATQDLVMFRWCISIHSLRVEGDGGHRHRIVHRKDFNPLPPCGGRHRCGARREWIEVFQSTPSVWRETALPACCSRRQSYFNPLPPCGGRRTSAGGVQGWSGISIHSLRVEGDRAAACISRTCRISIHSLRVEGDHVFSQCVKTFFKFQSTPSVWRET